jgi:hypothetical protein
LDQSDVSAIAGDLGKVCGLSKAGGEESAEVIMRWFGFTPTGRSIVIGRNGETGPEYLLTDPQQQAIAMGDPYGYRRHINSLHPIPWGAAKELYR